ncbi:MAG TPA: RDD family protein [Saprospiraceae bacterium]|nr:RDD family protein [Saprospiraceae bacterium]
MKKESINIYTSSNISLNYPKASLLYRILAFGFDVLIVGLIVILLSIIFGNNPLVSGLIIILISFWNLTFEILLNGQTLGKKILGLRIISMNGENPSIKSLIIRWSFKVIDILISLGVGAILAILSTRLNQRIGDVLAGTTVVETRTNFNAELNFLEGLNNNNYSVTYPDVLQYREEDIILMKEIYSRYRENNSINNQQLIDQITKKVCSDLEIKNPHDKDKSNFLKKVIEDYIMLTR